MARGPSVSSAASLVLLLAVCILARDAAAATAPKFLKFSPAAKQRYARAKGAQSQQQVLEKDADVVITFYIREQGILNSTSPVQEFDNTINVVEPLPGFEESLFGALGVSDSRAFLKPDSKSEVVGAFRFSYAWISNTGFNVQATGAFEFTSDKYFSFGTDVVFSGHDDAADAIEEYPVVGGTGFFRLAQGWLALNPEEVVQGKGGENFYPVKLVVFLPKLRR